MSSLARLCVFFFLLHQVSRSFQPWGGLKRDLHQPVPHELSLARWIDWLEVEIEWSKCRWAGETPPERRYEKNVDERARMVKMRQEEKLQHYGISTPFSCAGLFCEQRSKLRHKKYQEPREGSREERARRRRRRNSHKTEPPSFNRAQTRQIVCRKIW